MAYYVSKKRVDPSHLAQADLEESIKSSLSNSQYIDFIWALCSHVAPEKIPNWTGLNYLIHKKRESEDIQKVIYLPAIDASPAKLDTVLEIVLWKSCGNLGKLGSQRSKRLYCVADGWFSYRHDIHWCYW